MSSSAWVRADEGKRHETPPTCQLIPHDKAWLCEAINVSCWHWVEQCQQGHHQRNNKPTWRFRWTWLSDLQLLILSSWYGGYLQNIPMRLPMVLALLSFGNNCFVLFSPEGVREIVSLKIHYTFDLACARSHSSFHEVSKLGLTERKMSTGSMKKEPPSPLWVHCLLWR